MVLPVGLFLFSGTIKNAQRVLRLSFLKRQSQGSIFGLYDFFCCADDIWKLKIMQPVNSKIYFLIDD